MKTILKALLSRTLLRHPTVHHCSQTLYQALLACLRLWDATQQETWKQRADASLERLLAIQQPDGGFDIGYDFNFGRLHRKGESTAPELVGLIALCEYGQRFGIERIREPAGRAVDWIRRHAIEGEDGTWAIPYSPYSIREVMIYNGTSFAASGLGVYLGCVEDRPEVREIYAGMLRYLNGVMSRNDTLPGRFWYYADQTRTDLSKERAGKIDYYHQMQQVEVHALAEQRASTPEQLELIRDAADHIVALQERNEVLPYTEHPRHFGGLIHTWGLASVIPGLLEASLLVPERKESYHQVARRVAHWLLEHAWTGERFIAITTPAGQPVLKDYMVRSDAWVTSAMAAASVHLEEGPWRAAAEKAYTTLELVNFSGPENHASTQSKRVTGKVIERIRGMTSARKSAT